MDPYFLVLGWATTPVTVGVLLRIISTYILRGRFYDPLIVVLEGVAMFIDRVQDAIQYRVNGSDEDVTNGLTNEGIGKSALRGGVLGFAIAQAHGETVSWKEIVGIILVTGLIAFVDRMLAFIPRPKTEKEEPIEKGLEPYFLAQNAGEAGVATAASLVKMDR